MSDVENVWHSLLDGETAETFPRFGRIGLDRGTAPKDRD
jgi:hypothetical protein